MPGKPDLSSDPDPKTPTITDSRGAATLLGTTERHIRRLTSERDLPFLKVGGKVRFRLSDIEEYLGRHRVPDHRNGRDER